MHESVGVVGYGGPVRVRGGAFGRRWPGDGRIAIGSAGSGGARAAPAPRRTRSRPLQAEPRGSVLTLGDLPGGLAASAGLIGLALFVLVVRAVRFGRDGAPAPGRLGAANAITLARLVIFAGLGGVATVSLAFVPEAGAALGHALGWAPALAYGLAALADGLDGFVARRTGTESAFGARLDAETDALGMAAASGIVVLLAGVLPFWYLLAGFGRYLFGAALFVERRLGRRLADLPPSPFRRRLAGFQMGLLAVCLVPGIEPEWALPSTLALGIPFLAGFVRDYLLASGQLDPRGAGSRRVVARLQGLRPSVSRLAALLAAALGILKLAGFPTGSWGLAAFFFAWLICCGKTSGVPLLLRHEL